MVPWWAFIMLWEIDSFSKKYLKEITNAAKDSNKIILATDPDREGEAIAWHVKEVLVQKKLLKDKKIERVVFNEITKKAVTKGIENPRDIEPQLVDAYMARRALDYLVGFNISPILWTKLPGSKSAGRVQSVALKLISEREHEIELFNPEEFWTLKIKFNDNLTKRKGIAQYLDKLLIEKKINRSIQASGGPGTIIIFNPSIWHSLPAFSEAGREVIWLKYIPKTLNEEAVDHLYRQTFLSDLNKKQLQVFCINQQKNKLLRAIIHFKLHWMRSMFKFINFFKF